MREISVKNKQKLSIYQFATDKSTKKSSMKPRVEQWRKSIKISKIYRRYIRYITEYIRYICEYIKYVNEYVEYIVDISRKY